MWKLWHDRNVRSCQQQSKPNSLSLTLASLSLLRQGSVWFSHQSISSARMRRVFLALICCCNPLSACCLRSRAALGPSSHSQHWIKDSGRCVCRVQTPPPPKLGGKHTGRLLTECHWMPHRGWVREVTLLISHWNPRNKRFSSKDMRFVELFFYNISNNWKKQINYFKQ